ncbi:polyhydroxybutyrate depolymerase [Mycolicibacterium aromaticivorans JS19b1 = JCM 16368]|uniref:Polyhydroxybutyrate depolymerase n=1 Tax=Mycolicibacterium aromaticivorans JS19b1 = JCM 16368 TaxID=1440774 RepID=A0A064CKB5_9MYCO|nr:PHB depolymerase family esterase [Mycolicibacterium aromaticivorans]KDF00761.1 polyhydroxybutyrate depolymerase [Mycolicibacterium aromaticivorans JS19b1 = JCM 16368]
MWARRVALLVALCLVAACAPATGFAPGVSAHTIQVGGVDRDYRLYVPDGLPKSAPLVVMLHGWTGSAEQAQREYGWDEQADSTKFVVAYPDGVGGSWNADGCCGQASKDKVDDVGFITAAVRNITEKLDIDKTRIYAAGISNGGIMAYKLACNTDLFAAIGPDAATQLAACPAPRPTSVLHIHGTDDRLVRYDGQPGTALPIATMTPPDVSAFWRNVDHCEPPATTVDGDLTTSVAGCPSGRSVELITVAGGEHDWPSFATERMWDFFAAHPRASG